MDLRDIRFEALTIATNRLAALETLRDANTREAYINTVLVLKERARELIANPESARMAGGGANELVAIRSLYEAIERDTVKLELNSAIENARETVQCLTLVLRLGYL